VWNKPHYFFRPSQLVRRFRSGDGPVALPWGHELNVDPRESLGAGIARTGVHELSVTETIWRLLDPDDLAVDAGANYGYMTSLMSARAGRVVAFEPHPEVCETLRQNAAAWPNVEVREVALSYRAGMAHLSVSSCFTENMGTATLGSEGIPIRTERLDSLGEIDLLKLDVEGHEADVLCAAPQIRDVIFEDHDYPGPAAGLLVGRGYHIFAIVQRFTGARLVAPDTAQPHGWDAPNYLATRNEERARRRLSARGWQALR
jgi:FkbM family methyltransferase